MPSVDTRAPGDESLPVLRRVLIAAIAAWALLSIAALAAGDARGVLASGLVLGAVVLAVWLARWRSVRRLAALAVGAYTLVLSSVTIAVGQWGGDAARVDVLTGNPNVLAAAIVTALTAWAALAPGRRWVWWVWPAAALAVVHTGSRTSAGALLAAGIVWLVVLLLQRHRRLAWAALAFVALLGMAAFAWQRGVVELTPNLLAAPSDIADAAWRHERAERVSIEASGAPGPFAGTHAQRLVASARPDSTLLVFQSLGRSEAGVPYVASIYLRSDTPQRLVLTSHLARVTCEVTREWQRCVTPVGYGDDRLQRQFHLQAAERGGSVDVELFGAQYERDVEATPFVDARPAWIPQAMVNRFDLRRLTFVPSSRVLPWRAGAELFLDHPWFGVGLAAAPAAFVAATGAPIEYAHHIVVQWLAVHGLVGTLGIVLLLGALASLLPRHAWPRLAPMLVALALLNTWDVTLLEPTVLVTALSAVAIWLNGGAWGARADPRLPVAPRDE